MTHLPILTLRRSILASARQPRPFGRSCRNTGGTVLPAYGGGSIKKNGVYDEMKALLAEAGKEVVDFILAVGGGSAIDFCKVVSAQAALDTDLWEYEYKEGKTPPAGVPMGAVVTASGTGAEMNAGAVITYEEKLWKRSAHRRVGLLCRIGPRLYRDRAAHAGPLRCFRYPEPRDGDLPR